MITFIYVRYAIRIKSKKNGFHKLTNFYLKIFSSLQKSQMIIKALEKNKKDITYYALDLMEDELRRSLEWLSSLGEFQNVKLVGLWGSYEDGRDFAASLPE